MKTVPLLASLCCSAGLLLQPAVAADKDETDSVSFGSVVITGQKIERTQMETVSSVQIIDSEALETTTRADNLYDIVDMAPNVTDAGGFNSLAIRGIANSGPTAVDNGAGTIGIFIDNGLLTPRSVQNNALTTWDLDRVEILRGPQSTTGGRNSLAGQIILHTKDPEFTSGGAAKLLIGEDGTLQTAIAQTGPLSEKLAYRITADRQHTDGYVTNDILNDDDFNRSTSKNFRVKLLYLMDSGGEAMLTLGHTTFDENGDDTVDRNLEGRTSRLNFASVWETESDNLSLTIKQPINDELSFESNTGYIRSDFYRNSDFDGSDGVSFDTTFNPVPGLSNIPTDSALLEQNTDDFNFNQEFLLRYKTDRIKSVAGLYFAKGEMDDSYTTENIYLAGLAPVPLLLNGDTNPDEEFQSIALFGDIDYKVDDKLTLLAGLRINKEDRESRVSTTQNRALSYDIVAPGTDAAIDGLLAGFSGSQSSEKSSTVFLPKLGFNYTWSDDLTTGFVVQKGYRPGGVSVNPIRGVAQDYEEETTINYEASLRAQVNNQLSVNANVFYTDWKDQQVGISTGFNPLDFVIENAGESHLYGFELEANYAASANWEVFAGLGYTQTEFDKFELNGNDYSGQEFQFARNWTANLGSTYRFNNGWFAHGNISYASEGAASTTTPGTELDAYTIVNTKVGYEKNNWGIYAYANNLFDETYVTQNVNNVTYGNTTYGDPRVVGLVGTVKW